MMLSFVTNATLADRKRLEIFVPHVLSVFNSCIDEFIIVLDERKEEGRIKKLHGTSAIQEDIDAVFIEDLQKKDLRIKVVKCDYSRLRFISNKWFGLSNVNRCQAGTPIFAFLYGIENCKNDLIIRSDCDIFFHNRILLNQLLNENHADIIQLPMLNDEIIPFSTRVFFINRIKLLGKLPLKAYKLDILRQSHRRIKRRPVYMALEQIIEKNASKGKVEIKTFPASSGHTMHISRREYFERPGIVFLEQLFRTGEIPAKQLLIKHDFHPGLWSSVDMVSKDK